MVLTRGKKKGKSCSLDTLDNNCEKTIWFRAGEGQKSHEELGKRRGMGLKRGHERSLRVVQERKR